MQLVEADAEDETGDGLHRPWRHEGKQHELRRGDRHADDHHLPPGQETHQPGQSDGIDDPAERKAGDDQPRLRQAPVDEQRRDVREKSENQHALDEHHAEAHGRIGVGENRTIAAFQGGDVEAGALLRDMAAQRDQRRRNGAGKQRDQHADRDPPVAVVRGDSGDHGRHDVAGQRPSQKSAPARPAATRPGPDRRSAPSRSGRCRPKRRRPGYAHDKRGEDCAKTLIAIETTRTTLQITINRALPKTSASDPRNGWVSANGRAKAVPRLAAVTMSTPISEEICGSSGIETAQHQIGGQANERDRQQLPMGRHHHAAGALGAVE